MSNERLLAISPTDKGPTGKIGKLISNIKAKWLPARVDSERETNFEKWLFKNGPLQFDFDSYVKRREELDLASFENEKPYFDWCHDPQRRTEQFGKWRDDIQAYVDWLSHFDGKIPKHWGDYPVVDRSLSQDLYEAERRGVQFSEDLINAAITQPVWLDEVYTCARTQRLNLSQLTVVLYRLDGHRPFVDWVKEVIGVQYEKGMPQEDISRAFELAREAKERQTSAISLLEEPGQ